LANGFDVEQFADDVEAMGVEYVNFTAIHAGANVLYPSAFMNANYPSPGHASNRDLIREITDALHARGIKLQLYIHAIFAEPPSILEEDAIALGYYDSTDNYKRYNDFINGLYGELSARYGTYIDAYWIDTITFGPYLDKIDGQRLRNTILANCPNILISGNGSAEATVD
jgi:alpha-L-fucosidase